MAAINHAFNRHFEVNPIPDPSNSGIFHFNVGGAHYIINSDKLRKYPNTLLGRFPGLQQADLIPLCDGYFAESREYFFDRSALIFDEIATFYRTGKLHVPDGICPGKYYEELEFWLISKDFVSACCLKRLENKPSPSNNYLNNEGPSIEENASVYDTISFASSQTFGLGKAAIRLSKKQKENRLLDKFAPQFEEKCCKKARLKAWILLEYPGINWKSVIFCFVSVALILCSIAVQVLGSLPQFSIVSDHDQSAFFECKSCKMMFPENITTAEEIARMTMPHPALDIPDAICVIWFLLEYLLRLWTAPSVLQYMRRPFAIIDLLSIVPFFIEYGFRAFCICEHNVQEYSRNLLIIRILRFFRVLRVLRVLKLARYSLGVQLIGRSLKRAFPELTMLGTFIFILTIVYAVVIYYIEGDLPDTDYWTIPQAAWWVMITLTTVGYGDIVPKSALGKLFSVLVCYSGVVLLAFPVSIIVAKFGKTYEEIRRETRMRRKVWLTSGVEETARENNLSTNTVRRLNFVLPNENNSIPVDVSNSKVCI